MFLCFQKSRDTQDSTCWAAAMRDKDLLCVVALITFQCLVAGKLSRHLTLQCAFTLRATGINEPVENRSHRDTRLMYGRFISSAKKLRPRLISLQKYFYFMSDGSVGKCKPNEKLITAKLTFHFMAKQSHLMVHLTAVLVLSIISHDPHQVCAVVMEMQMIKFPCFFSEHFKDFSSMFA